LSTSAYCQHRELTGLVVQLEEETTTELSGLKSASQETTKQVAELRTTNTQLQDKNKALAEAK
jgi:hypothetical protein